MNYSRALTYPNFLLEARARTAELLHPPLLLLEFGLAPRIQTRLQSSKPARQLLVSSLTDPSRETSRHCSLPPLAIDQYGSRDDKGWKSGPPSHGCRHS